MSERRLCQALTQNGQPCKKYAIPGSDYCGIHNRARIHNRLQSGNGHGSEPEPVEEPVADAVPEEPLKTAEAPTSDGDLQKRLIAEVDRLIERVEKLTPGFKAPPFSLQGLVDLINKNLAAISPDLSLDLLKKIRTALGEDVLNIETLKGLWTMLNSTLQYQGDVLKRRTTGEYEVDEWGFDQEYFDAVVPFFDFMYKFYWRVEATGVENIPTGGRAMLVSNHSGQLPWDGAMVALAVYRQHPSQRLARTLYASWFPTIPFFSQMFVKCGQTLATEDNGIRLLEQDELIAVYPEGYKGVGKLYKERYRLARFGRGGFIRMALKTGAPIIPVAVVGAEETYISLAKSPTMARLTGFPYFPLSPTWPWLGLLGFVPIPTKWTIQFGEPIAMDGYGPDAAKNLVLVSQLTDQVRNIVQQMIYTRLSQRHSVLMG
jgi:1-acyl-sn-glycerol-3-phosphate acyltransferase